MPLVTYSALRLGLLAVCFGLGYWAGLRTWLLLGVAVLAAWALSYVLLARPRDAAATYLAARAERRGAGRGQRRQGPVDDDEAHEDAAVDRALADQPGDAAADRQRPAGAPRVTAADDAGDVPGDRRAYPGETASPSPNRAP